MKSTETNLRDRAANAAAKIEGANAVLAEAARADAAEQERLDALDRDNATREARMNPEDLGQVADIEARKKQLALLRAKAARESASRLEAARLESAELTHAAQLAELFATAYALYFEQARNSLLPFVDERLPIETEALSRTVNGLSGIARLHQWKNYPPPPDRALEILTKFIEGTPLWRC